jgi:flagellin-specific chaperone FliS
MAKKSLQDMLREKEKTLSPKEKQAMENLKKDVNKYKKMSNAEIVNELQKIRNKDKGGNINKEKINEFEKIISPMLNDNQKKQLQAIKKQMGFE